jgi:hypothetical protein
VLRGPANVETWEKGSPSSRAQRSPFGICVLLEASLPHHSIVSSASPRSRSGFLLAGYPRMSSSVVGGVPGGIATFSTVKGAP